MNSTRKPLIFLLLMLSPFALLSQNLNDFITGVLLDSNTEEPVVFATIRVKNKALGVISNNDGGFKVPIHFQLEGEELEISSMGYETKTIIFSELKERIINKIYLSPSAFELSETIVTASKRKKLNAKQIIRKALKRIPENYQNNPFELIGYYRDYQLNNENYLNLNEALVRVIDQGFNIEDYQSLQFGMYDYIENFEFERDSFAAKPYDYSNRDKTIPDATLRGNYMSNELVLLFVHDAIRNHNIEAYSYVHKLVDDFIKEHRFERLANTSFDGELVYRIQINKTTHPFVVEGSMFVDVNDFAIRKFDYAVYKQKPSNNPSLPYSSIQKDLLYEILVEYHDFEDKMYLNYISFHNQFRLIRPPKFFIENVVVNSNEKKMIISLNRSVSNWPDLKLDDFVIQYQRRRIKITQVEQVDSTTFAVSFPKSESKQQKELDLLFSEYVDTEKNSLGIYVEKMLDAEGNHLGEREMELLDQFREFFTQKVETKPSKKSGASLVNKMQSLMHSDQPIIQKDKLVDGLWMNTPLKSIK